MTKIRSNNGVKEITLVLEASNAKKQRRETYI